jgi:signal transduction histidine kinase
VVGVSREVAAAALARAALIGRAAATVIAAAAGLLLIHDRRPVLAAIALVIVVTAVELAALGRWPGLVTHPILAIVLDSALVLGVLAVSQGGVAYFCFAAGAGAVAGVLLGLKALPVWAIHAALGFTVIAELLRRTDPPVDIMALVVAFPMAGALAGVGAAMATTALTNQLELSTQLVASAQRSAVASERARLARELHDSVTKTLRGVSLAALALPSVLRRQPALAEHLAGTVVAGATAAAQQARELLEEMRFDVRHLAAGVDELCQAWSTSTGIQVQVSAAAVNPPVAVSYELTRILREALANVARHGRARWVGVRLAPQPHGLMLEITDDGVGFAVPDDLTGLQSAGHFGIVGMNERARTIGGALRIESAPGSGTRITVQVPLDAPVVPSHRRSIGAR